MRAHRFIPGRPTRVGLAALLGLLAASLALVPATAAPATGTKSLQFVTQASPSVNLGGTISDTGSVLGDPFSPKPTGSITFRLYGPDDPTCSTTPVFTSTVPVTRLNTLSGPFTPTLPGTYRYVGDYTGDSVYAPATSKCNSQNESVLVTEVTPTLTTTASPGVQVGGTVTDTATLTGGKNPTGSIEFGLFPPNDPTCSGGVVFRSTVAISDPASVTSEAYSPPVAGTYHWEARYTGDHVNGPVKSGCNDANESVEVTAAPGIPGSSMLPSTTGPGGSAPIACNPAATARAVLDGLAATLTGKPGAGFRSTCSAGLRIVLRAKEIRPGNPGFPRGDGFTTMANVLSHISPTGPALNFSLNQQGLALRDYAQANQRSLIAFLVVHVRPDKSSVSTESLQILTLGIG
jgi:hypothetical protein